MSHKKPTGPSLFCEWVVGTTIPSVLGTRKPKSRRRNVIRVELTTDDESEEDTISITYPRSGRAEQASATRAKSKKVHFEGVPKKSALRKTQVSTASSDSSAEESDSSASETSTKITLVPEDSVQIHTVETSSSNSKKKPVSETDSENDSDPHPTSKAKSKSAKKGKKDKSEPKEPPVSESESAKESDDAGETMKEGKKDKKAKKNKQGKENGEEDKTQETKNKTKDITNEPGMKGKKNKKDKNSASDEAQEKGSPEFKARPHSRRPDFLEPLRAEVIQTERVIETPQDPPPNAYYDAQHNILRVYHGPVYGGSQTFGSYPKRDSANHPLPLGPVNPAYNPYYYGFGNIQPHQNSGQHVPGIPAAQWPSIGFPPGYPPFPPGGPAQGGSPGGTKGAFSDKAGRNNVSPASIKSDGQNPYYNPNRSPFSAYNKSAAPQATKAWNTDGSPANTKYSPRRNGTGSNGSPTPQAQPSANAWGCNDNKGSEWPSNDGQQSGDGTTNWNQDSSTNNAANAQGGDQSGGWSGVNGSTATTSGGQAGWGDQNQAAAPTTNDSNWGNGSNGQAYSSEGSNVIPGTFPGQGPAWGDTSMAADTGGKVEQTGGEFSEPVGGW